MLSKKAQQLLSKESKTKRSIKFKLGGPTVNIDPTFNPLAGMDNAGYGFDNSNYQMNLNQPLLQDLNTAQNYNYNQIQNNVQAQQQQGPVQPQTPVQQPQGNWMDFAGGAGKIAYGIKSLVEGQKERKNAKIYERISKEENDRRLENQRQTGFVLTPYTNKRTWSMKKGGMYIPMPSPGTYQEGGQIDSKAVKSFDKEKLKAVQQDLKSKGLYKGKIDGVYGPKTNAAIQGYNDKNTPWEENPYKLTTSDNNPSLPHVTNRTEMQKELDSRGKTRGQDQQMLPDAMNKRLAENFYPVDYVKGSYSNPVVRTAAALTGEKDPLSPKSQKEKDDRNLTKRYDAWQMYMGQPQTNKSFKISKYTPAKAKSDQEEYYDFTDDNLKKHLIDNYAKGDFNSMVVHDFTDANNTMGNFTIRKGKDNNGDYISYYDKWDLAGSKGVGKPFEIMGRAYYDPKTGKQLPEPESQFQEGGLSFNNNLENFMNSYGDQMEQQQLQNQMFQDHYDNTNAQKKLKWKSMQQQGVQSLKGFYKDAQDMVGKVVGMMQDGGEIEMDQMNAIEQPDTESLYSPDFQSPVQQEEDFAPEETFKSGLESWIFQDEAPMPDMETAQKYNQSFSPISSGSMYGSNTSSGSGSMDIIESIKKHESGGNPEATNMIGASGYYQFTPAWADKIAPFMGLPQGTPKGKVMEAFRKNPQAQDAFMKHVVDNIYMPKIEQLRPYANKYGFNDNEMIKLLHYRGLNDTEKRLKTGNFEVSQEEKRKYNNPDILTYIKSK